MGRVVGNARVTGGSPVCSSLDSAPASSHPLLPSEAPRLRVNGPASRPGLRQAQPKNLENLSFQEL